MYRQERLVPQSHLDLTNPKQSGEARRAPKNLPSGSQLPTCWNEAMDRAICHMEAQNEVDPGTMTRLLKRRFPELEGYVIPTDAIERRISTLELQHNDYFKSGMEVAIANAEARGLVLPAYDPLNYPGKHYPMKSDLEIFGSGGAMTGTLSHGASNVPEPTSITRGVSNFTNSSRSKVPERKITLSPSPVRQASAHNEGVDNRRVHLAGEPVHPHNLADISNTYNAPGMPVQPSSYRDNSPKQLPSTKYEKGTVNPAPSTPVNSQAAPNFSTPRSRDRAGTRGEISNTQGSHHHATPSSRDRSRNKPEIGRIPTASSSSGPIYRSGMENAASGRSTSTTGTSILGREISGMSAALERRQYKIDQRVSAND